MGALLCRAGCCLSLLLASSITQAADPSKVWFLNHIGTLQRYKVSRFHDDGQVMVSAFAVADPTGGIGHYVQPSAVSRGGVTHLFVLAYEDGAWNRVHLFMSSNNISFSAHGAVFQADETEPYGIAQPSVTVDPSRSDPFLMYYVVRGANGVGTHIAAASSVDGHTWTRHGAVLTATGAGDEAHGISLGYVCRKADGAWTLWYNAFDTSDLMHTTGKVATASAPLGTFGSRATIATPDGLTFFLASAYSGNGYAVMASAAKLPIGVPVVVEGATQATQEVMTPTRQDGNVVYFDAPFRFTHTNRPLHSSIRNKLLPSYVQEQPDGSWRGIFTSFGANTGLMTEYTLEYEAASYNGTWTPRGTGLRFKPWFGQGLYSTENPSPLVSDPSCSN
jgi:hypothetical protein